MKFKTDESVTEREVKTVVKDVSKTYTLTLTEEEAELMILLTGSIEGTSASGKDYKKFGLDLSYPDGAAYPHRKLKCNPDDLRRKLTDKIWEYLNTERAK